MRIILCRLPYSKLGRSMIRVACFSAFWRMVVPLGIHYGYTQAYFKEKLSLFGGYASVNTVSNDKSRALVIQARYV